MGYGNYGSNYYNYGSSSNNIFNSSETYRNFAIIALIIGIVGAIVLFATFLRKKNKNKFTGFLDFLYDFLHFDNLFAEKLVKWIYLASAIFLTVYCIGTIVFIASSSMLGKDIIIWICLGVLVLGNILLRVVFEFLIIRLVVCRNTSEINKKLGKMDSNEILSQTENFNMSEGTYNAAQPAQKNQPVNNTKPVQSYQPAQNTPPIQSYQPAQNTPPVQSYQPTQSTQQKSDYDTTASSDVTFCRNCGVQFSSDETYCPNCGTKR